jgi:KDO2-lipid IV(A) lauroyltransferase
MTDETNRQPATRLLRYRLEALLLRLAWGLFAGLPLERASDLGGAAARWLGPRLAASKRARLNLRLVLPELGPTRHEEIIRGAWDNLGRTFAEYPHLGTITDEMDQRITIDGRAHLEELRDSGSPGFLVSGHFANWEVMHLVGTRFFGDVETLIREPNNPFVRDILDRHRGGAGGRRIPKGRHGARATLAALKRGAKIAALVDQKASDGWELSFFGKPAMTTTAIADLAIREEVPLLLVRLERRGAGRFHVTVLPPIEPPKEGGRLDKARASMQRINDQLEQWIRDKPEDWLWLHRRWPKSLYRGLGRGG